MKVESSVCFAMRGLCGLCLSLLVVFADVGIADVFQCQIDGVRLYSDQYCGPSTKKIPMPVVASNGIALVAPQLVETTEHLSNRREKRETAQELKQAQQALIRLSLTHQREQEALSSALLSLPDSPSYRNWKSNPVREEKLKVHQKTLRERIKLQSQQYKVSQGLLTEQIKTLVKGLKAF